MSNKVYTANEIYQMKPESVSLELGELQGFYYDHLREIEDSLWGLNNQFVEINTVKDFDFDGRRCWTLRTVFFKGIPVMIVQNAGREGDDHRQRFITNLEVFKDMVVYIRSLLEIEDDIEVIDADEPMQEITSFYGNNLDGVFERY